MTTSQKFGERNRVFSEKPGFSSVGIGKTPQGRVRRIRELRRRGHGRGHAAAPDSADVPHGQLARSAGTSPVQACCADGLCSSHHETGMHRHNGEAIHLAFLSPRHNARAYAPAVGRAVLRSGRW